MSVRHDIQVTVQVGKNGLTKELLLELAHQLKKRKIVKVKFLKSCSEDFEDLAQKISEDTSSKIISKIGHVIVLAK